MTNFEICKQIIVGQVFLDCISVTKFIEKCTKKRFVIIRMSQAAEANCSDFTNTTFCNHWKRINLFTARLRFNFNFGHFYLWATCYEFIGS